MNLSRSALNTGGGVEQFAHQSSSPSQLRSSEYLKFSPVDGHNETASDRVYQSSNQSEPLRWQDQLFKKSVIRKLNGGLISTSTPVLAKMEYDSSDGLASQDDSNDTGDDNHFQGMMGHQYGSPSGRMCFPVGGAGISDGGFSGGDCPPEFVEEAMRKRELRLLKNKEAAKECRRKKKDYVKCLENRVAILEMQNRTLIDELKSLKELYCKTDQNS